MKKLIVDMDDVLCGKGFIRMVNEFLGTNYQEEDAEIKLLFTAYHNVNITDEELKAKNLIRVNNWKEIEKILL